MMIQLFMLWADEMIKSWCSFLSLLTPYAFTKRYSTITIQKKPTPLTLRLFDTEESVMRGKPFPDIEQFQ